MTQRGATKDQDRGHRGRCVHKEGCSFTGGVDMIYTAVGSIIMPHTTRYCFGHMKMQKIVLKMIVCLCVTKGFDRLFK